MATDNMQETLDRLLRDLQSNETERCLNALLELKTLKYSSLAVLKELERLALKGTDENVRSRAIELIKNRVHQNVRVMVNTLGRQDRLLLLKEIEQWQMDGLLLPDEADVIKQRYNFDIRAPLTPPSLEPAVEKEVPNPPAPHQPATPAAPRLSLTQTLLSESSIKIYLYLGAFFVIASALILAALVEAARLPILGVATLVFGGAAFLLHKRLPQPSFALFIVFSFLLPIDANVLVETLGLTEPDLSMYWMLVFLALAGIWTFSVWSYESRFFSGVAFISLCLAFYRFGEIFHTNLELQIFLGMLASLTGLAGAFLLKKWKGLQFSLFVFLLAQILTAGLLIVSFSMHVDHLFDSNPSDEWWLLIALTWLAAASFYALSDLLLPTFIFPWLAAGVLLPLPWFILQTFDNTQPIYAFGFWIWGTVLALTSEALLRVSSESLKRFYWPLLAASLPLFLAAFLIALTWEMPVLPFAAFALAALVYIALHWMRPRWYVWSAALFCALLAYFTLFYLPGIESFQIPFLYQVVVASMVLVLPELFTSSPLSLHSQTRLPAITLGAFISLLGITLALVDSEHTGSGALALFIYGILFTLHGLHARQEWLGYFAAAAESLAVVYALDSFNLDLWLPALTGLTFLYYAAGFFFRRGRDEMQAWGSVLVNSGLALGILVSFSSLVLAEETGGWYILLIAVLFVVELFARPLTGLEVIVEVLLSLALFQILSDFHVNGTGHFLFGASLIWLGGDLLFGYLIQEKRVGRLITIAVGYILVFVSTVLLWDQTNQTAAAIYFSVYAIFFGFSAVLQHEPRLGYLATAFLPLAVVTGCEVVNFEKWSFPLIVLSILYFTSGSWLRRKGNASGWDQMLIYSGLGLAVLTSFRAPFEGSLDASIPVAIAATLFAVEAFALRNVWLAIPANMLYLLSYFMILVDLDVDEPQFYSIGAALLGMLMHYLLTRAGSRTGAFIAGMLSQLVLLGTTYIQMVSTGELSFFFVLFVQSMVVLIYGLIQRSRSLVITPIAFAVVGVMTVVYSALKGLGPVILIGSTGLVLLMAGIVAVLMRERISKLGEQLSDWKP